MNKFHTFLAVFLLTATTFAQAPEKMSYQAVVRDSGDNLVTNQAVGMQISILQASASGTEVYVETQNPSTNINGLVTLEIGAGTIVNGDFTTIDWSDNTYFIKTETDPTGGANYTITGTSQLLSVPYALFAKTAANTFSGDYNDLTNAPDQNNYYYADRDNDGYGDAWNVVFSPVAPAGYVIDNTDCDDTDNTVVNPSQQYYVDADGDGFGSATAEMFCESSAPAGYSDNNTDCDDAEVTAYPGAQEIIDGIDNDCDGQIDEASIGQFRDGGVVFWVDPADNSHGLVCAIQDESSLIAWWNGSYIVTNATGGGYGEGSANTDAIIAAQGANETDYAAGLARAYSGGGFNDWYLPNENELAQMYVNTATIDATAIANGGLAFTQNMYWTSSEWDNNLASSISFYDGFNLLDDKAQNAFVRPVRAF